MTYTSSKRYNRSMARMAAVAKFQQTPPDSRTLTADGTLDPPLGTS